MLLEKTEITGITADSRLCRPGFLFVALPGTKADGRAFIQDAVENGAVAVLVQTGTEPEDAWGEIPFIHADNPRHALGLLAAKCYGRHPKHIVAVTGTNGKTSTVHFCRQLWQYTGREAASIGTLGVVDKTCKDGLGQGNLTTPDTVALHKSLAELAVRGVDYVAVEASSHGLDQERLAGVNIEAAAITNISRDHLDYHPTVEHYKATKFKLFSEVLNVEGAAIINADIPEAPQIRSICTARGLRVLSCGTQGEELKLVSINPTLAGQEITVRILGAEYSFTLPLIGAFQTYNLLGALGLVIASGVPAHEAVEAAKHVTPVPGRMQPVATHKLGAPILVDYAHTPDALEKVLLALRPHVTNKLRLVFGCGGDRDKGKRPEMGRIAVKCADDVIITDDNPRTEDAATIRREILAGCPGTREIGDRKQAIRIAIQRLRAGDVLVIAGKGHEDYQIIGTEKHPFSDAETARDAVENKPSPAGGRGQGEGFAQPAVPSPEIRREDSPGFPPLPHTGGGVLALWSSADAAQATGGKLTGEFAATGVSIDTRTLKPGDLFVALKGENHDGRDYIGKAMEAGAAAALVSHVPEGVEGKLPLLVVEDTLRALWALAKFRRQESGAKIIAVTGSVGKTSIKNMLASILVKQGKTHATSGNYNNHIGLPLTLARLPQNAVYGVFELGMNHAGELRELTKLLRPYVAVVTAIEAVHLEFFGSLRAISEAKAEIFEGVEPGGAAVVPYDTDFLPLLAGRAHQHGIAIDNIASFGVGEYAAYKLLKGKESLRGQELLVRLKDKEMRYRLGTVGRHQALNSIAALAAVRLAGADVEKASAALAFITPPEGRGRLHALTLDGIRYTLLDDSYNASPASMRAAFHVLRLAEGRKIAALGDMLELGKAEDRLHAGLAEDILRARVDKVFTAGERMRKLYDALPENLRGAHCDSALDLLPIVRREIAQGDTLLVKGSHGSQMWKLAEALKKER